MGDPGHWAILTVDKACAKLLVVSPLSCGFEAADRVFGSHTHATRRSNQESSMKMLRIAQALVILSSLASAQSSLISPVEYANLGGIPANDPFGRVGRFMQVHGDLRGRSLLMKGLSFRPGGSSAYTSHTVDMEIWLGPGDFAKLSSRYASNYLAAPTQVFKRAKVNTPPRPVNLTSPAPFDFRLLFQSTFLHSGRQDLTVDLIVHATTWSTGDYLTDTAIFSGTVIGKYKALGTGCIVNGTSPMTAEAYQATELSPPRVRYYCFTRNAPRNSPGAILVGLKNLAVAFPICGPKTLYTDALVTLPVFAGSGGYFGTGYGPTVPWQPTMAGVKLFTQSYALDSTQRPLPVAVSNGVESITPNLATMPDYAAIQSNNPAAIIGTVRPGRATVIRFDG